MTGTTTGGGAQVPIGGGVHHRITGGGISGAGAGASLLGGGTTLPGDIRKGRERVKGSSFVVRDQHCKIVHSSSTDQIKFVQ